MKDNCNHLSKENSPYLKQHATNPVCWYAWGEEAFRAAREQNKPIFLSIGYSTCYWCHVMEKDSFEREDLAKVLNKHFISIKVDREERPDVDDIYMDAVNAMTGRGGWPLSVFLTPELKPFWGGTFFYREKFTSILKQLSDTFQNEPEKITAATQSIESALTLRVKPDTNANISEQLFKETATLAKKRFDSHHGGFSKAPKFPPSMLLDTLIGIDQLYPEHELQNLIFKTLDGMARGGMYDQAGGGFHRYSVDERWEIPHFEKMLYDNAQLANTYLEADRVYNRADYRAIAIETLEFMQREMLSKDGVFYAALDAGEVDKEGEYYVWEYKDISEFANAKKYFQITESGNFEHQKNVLTFKPQNLIDRTDKEFHELQKNLLTARKKRPYPHLDNKAIVSWNALSISTFVKAYQQLKNSKHLMLAQKAASFILEHALKDTVLFRSLVGKNLSNPGVSEDYRFSYSSFVRFI